MSDTAFKPYQAAFWIVGLKNKRQAPAVIIDIHNEEADYSDELRQGLPLIRHRSGKPSIYMQAKTLAMKYAKSHGIPRTRVYFDPDSTQFYEED